MKARRIQVLEPAVKPAEDRGVVLQDVEDLVTLQVQDSVEGLGISRSRGR